jgi:TonB family protein
MTISSKDTLESADPAVKSAAPSSAAPSKPDNARLRADAVSLDVPVKVHGSRVSDVAPGAPGALAQTEPFEEETSTMIVFPHGGVLRMATAVNVGQMLVVTNQKTKQDAICRVVKVRAYSNTQAYVEVEFTHRQSGYWGVHFSSEDEEFGGPGPAASKPEPLLALPVESRRPDPPVVSSVSVKVEDLPKPFVSTPRPESAFVSIGSHEDFQISATNMSTLASPPAPLRESIAPPAPIPPPVIPAPVSRPAPPPAPLAEAPVEAPRSSSRAFGTLTGEISASSTSDMGTRLGGSYSESSSASSSSGKGLLIAAVAAIALVAVAGGAWYFHQHPSAAVASQQSAATQAPVNTNPSPSSTSSSSSLPETQNLPPAGNSQPAMPAGDNYGQITSVPAPGASHAAPEQSAPRTGPHVVGEEVPAPAAPAPAAPAQQKAMGNIGVAVLGAHPVTNKKSSGNVAAPEIPAMPSSSALPNMAGNSPNLAPPLEPTKRVRVGGLLVPAKLLRSNPPVYPSAARQSGVEGDVVVSAQVDEHGNITAVQAVSGLSMLRQAALDAVRTWKYQPATLDGDAVSSQISVTVQFRK